MTNDSPYNGRRGRVHVTHFCTRNSGLKSISPRQADRT